MYSLIYMNANITFYTINSKKFLDKITIILYCIS